MIRTPRAALGAVFLAAALLPPLGGCDALEAQDAFEEDAARPASGIARTDRDGNLIQDDPDDWRTAPLYAISGFRVTARAFPNPAGFSEGVTIQMQTGDAIPGGLRLVAFKDAFRVSVPGQQCETPGDVPCAFAFFPSEIAGAQPGDLWRLIVFDGQSNVVTYGDLLIGS
jgi:hypothetical protein